MKQYKDPAVWKQRREFIKQFNEILTDVMFSNGPVTNKVSDLFDLICNAEEK